MRAGLGSFNPRFEPEENVMGSALSDEDAAIGTSSPAGAPHLSPTPAQPVPPPHATVVRLLDNEMLRDSRRLLQRRPRPDRSPAAPLTVLTNDTRLADLVIAAVPPDYRVFIAKTLEEVEEFAATDRCAVFVTDQTVARGELDRIIAILRTHESALVTIAVGDREHDAALVDLLAEGVIDRFMVRPLKPEPTRLVIESASREHHSLKAKSRSVMDDASQCEQAGGAAAVLNVTAPFRRTTECPSGTKPATGSSERAATTLSTMATDRTPPTASTPMLPERRSDAASATNAPAGTQSSQAHDEDAVASRERVAADQPTRDDWRTNETIMRMESAAPHATLPADAAPAARDRRFVRSPWFGAAMGIIVTAAVAAFIGGRQSRDGDLQDVIAKNLTTAQSAYDQGRLVDPPEASALQSYRTVLVLDPDNVAAKNGLERIASRLIVEARTFIRDQRLTQAVETLQRVRGVQPDHPELPALNAQLRLALQARLLEQARAAGTGAIPEQAIPNELRTTTQTRSRPRDAASARASQADKQRMPAGRAELAPPAAPVTTEPAPIGSDWFALVLRRTDENQLLVPGDDSALHYYDLLKQSGGSATDLQRATAALGAKLTANAQVEIYRKDLELADSLLRQATEIGYTGDDLAAAQAALATARAPVPSAASVSKAGERPIARYVAPEYPREALDREIEGWIDVRLEVNPAGEVVQATIEDGLRRQLFGRAALKATRQWKYAPRDDSTTIDTVKARVRFELKD
jgi:TonB family protein